MGASIIRTLVPVIVGVILAQALKIGLNLPEGAVTDIVTVVLTTGYYALARLIEQRWPWLGRILLSFGLTDKQPTYADQ